MTWLLLFLTMATDASRVDFHWNRPQTQFIRTGAVPGGPTVYLDFEGAVRAGKSTPAAHKLARYAIQYPGIWMAATRWAQDYLDAQIKPIWRDTAKKRGLSLLWHPNEEYDEILSTESVEGINSRVYLRALKATDISARFSKLAGLTLGILRIDQPEELPEDIYNAYVPARLSQPGYPHEVWLTPNPPREDHWLARKFPEDNRTPNRVYIRTTVYDNRHNLGDEYIAELEREYPEGTVLRRRFIEGRRGLNASGKPVYGGYFNRDRHAVRVDMNPDLGLVESWDYGFHRPSIVWLQFTPWGGCHILGGVMGEDIYLEDFAPLALAQRAEWFPDFLQIDACSDPAGDANNSQGTNRSGLDTLQEAVGYKPRTVKNSNAPEMRDFAIQTLAGYMRRRDVQGHEAFQIDPRRWRIVSQRDARTSNYVVDGLEAGYVWDERIVRSSRGKSISVPLKDKYYEHAMNCLEYGVLNYGPAMPSKVDEKKLERQLLKRAQQDTDPDDQPRLRRIGGRSIGGRGQLRRGGY